MRMHDVLAEQIGHVIPEHNDSIALMNSKQLGEEKWSKRAQIKKLCDGVQLLAEARAGHV